MLAIKESLTTTYSTVQSLGAVRMQLRTGKTAAQQKGCKYLTEQALASPQYTGSKIVESSIFARDWKRNCLTSTVSSTLLENGSKTAWPTFTLQSSAE